MAQSRTVDMQKSKDEEELGGVMMEAARKEEEPLRVRWTCVLRFSGVLKE